jgi:FKBP-type peptidyl-prolyl cis-trans isomerase
MKKLSLPAILVCTLVLAACNDATKTAKPAELTTDDQKSFYTLGVLMSQQIEVFGPMTPEELALVQRGLTDGVNHAKPAVDTDQFRMKLQEIAQARMKAAADKAGAAGVAYLDKASKEAGATKTASGMVIKQTKEGTGAQPKKTDEVKVHYEGRLIDGKVFDSSIARNEPATFPLDGVIPCWTEGLQTMKVGGKAQLICPSDLAYGPSGRPPTIPPAATLVFDVELLDIVKPK